MKSIVIASAGLAMIAGLGSMPQSAEAQARGVPRGSYQQTCREAYVNQGRLYADCRDERGRTRESSIELNRCSSSDIGNQNGRLVCAGHRGDVEDRPGGGWDNGRPDRPGNGWDDGRPGVQGGEIVIYRDANFQGRSLPLRGPVPNLRASGFNDQISSLRLRGSWEVCTDADYRGRCEVVSGDMRNLERIRMNDQISSMRPAGRGGRY